MKSNTFEALIGAVVIIFTLIFLFFGFQSMRLNNEGNYNVSAVFNRIDGIKLGSDIRMSGIKIGTVSSQELDNITFQARVLMSIDSDIRIPDDSSAKITTDGLLGGNYISIEPGGNDIYLESGDEILFTQGSVDLIGLVGEALSEEGVEGERAVHVEPPRGHLGHPDLQPVQPVAGRAVRRPQGPQRRQDVCEHVRVR